jgi:hypothetical protein
MTVSARQIIDDAFHGIGGTERLIAWINKSPKNESAWWNNIWPRIIPVSATVRGEVRGEFELTHRLEGEELKRALEEAGLPPSIFDAPVPVLDVEPKLIELNVPAKINGGEANRQGPSDINGLPEK